MPALLELFTQRAKEYPLCPPLVAANVSLTELLPAALAPPAHRQR